jgi:hypothetical protein
LPIVLAAVGVCSLVLAILLAGLIPKLLGGSVIVLVFYIFWLTCLGSIGAVAFIAMNALSVQEDATFDLTNNRLMILRIVLGGLFGMVITLPFGFDSFLSFLRNIVEGSSQPVSEFEGADGTVLGDSILMLMPFVLGFSTSLVILILNRLVEAVQSFFGRGPTSTERPTLPTMGNPQPPMVR